MRISDIKSKINLKPQNLSVQETPHLTIEPNMTCNIKCRGCYNLYKDHVKSLDEVKAEIDIALEKRNLETITLLGGEPTLHPDLIAIISYIKSKNLICALITNGIVLLSDKEDCLLDAMIGAGLDRIVLHVDLGQAHIHEDIEATRLVLFEKMERKKIFFSLSTTIYPDATIRNGRLTPICVADLISPMGENSNQEKVHRDLRRLVYSCMEEI